MILNVSIWVSVKLQVVDDLRGVELLVDLVDQPQRVTRSAVTGRLKDRGAPGARKEIQVSRSLDRSRACLRQKDQRALKALLRTGFLKTGFLRKDFLRKDLPRKDLLRKDLLGSNQLSTGFQRRVLQSKDLLHRQRSHRRIHRRG